MIFISPPQVFVDRENSILGISLDQFVKYYMKAERKGYSQIINLTDFTQRYNGNKGVAHLFQHEGQTRFKAFANVLQPDLTFPQQLHHSD